jgi:hypothetical protein
MVYLLSSSKSYPGVGQRECIGNNCHGLIKNIPESSDDGDSYRSTDYTAHTIFFFLDFPIYLQSVYTHSNTISKLCVEKRGQVEECSVAPLLDKRVKHCVAGNIKARKTTVSRKRLGKKYSTTTSQ